MLRQARPSCNEDFRLKTDNHNRFGTDQDLEQLVVVVIEPAGVLSPELV